MKKYTLFVLLLLTLARPTFAQVVPTVVNPTILEFDVAPDYNNLDLAGVPVVTSLTYNAIGMNGSGAVAVTVGLGKPTATPGTKVTLPMPGLSAMTVNQLYTATVTATGPSGSGVSAPSNPFGVAASTAPGKPSNVRAR